MQILPQYHQNLRKLNGTDEGYNKLKGNKKKKRKKKCTLYNSCDINARDIILCLEKK
jgi:hypothetical protein